MPGNTIPGHMSISMDHWFFGRLSGSLFSPSAFSQIRLSCILFTVMLFPLQVAAMLLDILPLSPVSTHVFLAARLSPAQVQKWTSQYCKVTANVPFQLVKKLIKCISVTLIEERCSEKVICHKIRYTGV